MDDRLMRALRRLFHGFGRPDAVVLQNARNDEMDEFDTRISDLERRQQDIAARLRLLEIQGTPRGQRHG